MIREEGIEQYLTRRVLDLGGISYKLTPAGRAGKPDRLIILGGRAIFVELKAPGEVPTAAQEREHARLRARGQRVLVIDSKRSVDRFIKETIG